MRTKRHTPTYTIDHGSARSFRHSVERAMQAEIAHLREQCARLESINDRLNQEADERRRALLRYIKALRRSRQDVRERAAHYAVEYMRSVGREVTVEEVLGLVQKEPNG